MSQNQSTAPGTIQKAEGPMGALGSQTGGRGEERAGPGKRAPGLRDRGARERESRQCRARGTVAGFLLRNSPGAVRVPAGVRSR